MSGKGGILAELARRVELNRQKAIDSPILRARWRGKYGKSGENSPPSSPIISPMRRVKSLLPGISENKQQTQYLTRTNSEGATLHGKTLQEQQSLAAVFQAVREKKHKKIKCTIKDNKLDTNVLNFRGVGALHEACYLGYLKCVKALVDNGADVNFPDSEGWTPLFAAVCGEHIDCIKYLVQHGAIINCRDLYGITPVRIAVSVKDIEIIDYLVKRGADIMAPADDGRSPFQVAVELADDSVLTYFLHLPSLHVT